MANIKVSVVQKLRYGVLLLPIFWLLFSLWLVVNLASEGFIQHPSREAASYLTTSNIITIIFPSLLTISIFRKIVLAIKNHYKISAELMSSFAFFLGMTLMALLAAFHSAPSLFYIGIALTDVAALIMLTTLLQGKPFAETTLYRKDIQLRRA